MKLVHFQHISPLDFAFRQMLRGFYMSSRICADTDARCRACGCRKFSYIKFKKFDVPTCSECGEEPSHYRLRRYLPSVDGRSVRYDIRYGKDHERIVDVHDAIVLARQIDQEIQTQTFKPTEYMSKVKSEIFSFENIIKSKYLTAQESKLGRGELSPAGLKIKKTAINHLMNYFCELDVRKIGTGNIYEFYETFTGGDRTRVLATQELKVILNYLHQIGMIDSLPRFPKLKASKKRDVENFLTSEEQELVISKIKDPLYLSMITILAHYAMRPCEIRALQWQDLDFDNSTIAIQRHFSNGTTLLSGRKSNEETLFLPMTPVFRNCVKDLKPGPPQSFVFQGKEGGAVGDRVLSRHWKQACIDAGVKPVQLYEGTKHSRLTILKSKGYSDDHLILLSGHSNVDTVKRYAQRTNETRLALVRGMVQ